MSFKDIFKKSFLDGFAGTLDLIIEVRTAQGADLIGQVMALEGVTSASLLSHDGEVTF